MSLITTKPTIAFFGATGLCVLTTLADSLKAGYQATALARTPSKLTTALASRGVGRETIDAHLEIQQGDIRDTAAVTKALTLDGRVVDIIISGIGGTSIKLTLNPIHPLVLTDPTICEDGAKTILDALRVLKPITKPLMLVISSTGIGDGKRDLPVLMVPLYHWILESPHADKKAMEKAVIKAGGEAESYIGDFVIVRSSLMTNGARLGTAKVRTGIETPGSSMADRVKEMPAIGYTISREDVGGWIFEEIVEKREKKWIGKYVTLTH